MRRAAVLLKLGRAEILTSGPAAVEHLTEAHELLEDPLARGQAEQTLARALLLTGRTSDAAAVASRAATELPPRLGDLRSALEAFEFMAVFFGAGDPEGDGQGEAFDWGETEATPLAQTVTETRAWAFNCRFDFGFSSTEIAAYTKEGILIAASFNQFSDGSDRADYWTREFFYRERGA